jgi:PIN domain nuclease of toxin-antitoxin system
VILLDPHAVVWSVADSDASGKRYRGIIRQALKSDQVAVSAFSFWEIALLIAARRLRLLETASELR